jgi:hypothetical protein
MKAAPCELLQTLQEDGFELSITPTGGLAVIPSGRLTDPIRALIREHKSDIIDALTASIDFDRWCWPHSTAMNTREMDTFLARMARFADVGMSYMAAERLADQLVIRDRDSDDRRLCLECRHLSGRGAWRCGNWQMAGVALKARDAGLPADLVHQLQRCAGFTEAKSTD